MLSDVLFFTTLFILCRDQTEFFTFLLIVTWPSLSYLTRSSFSPYPINILIDNIIIGTFGSVASSSWTLFSQSFTIPNSTIVVLKLIGLVSLLQQSIISPSHLFTTIEKSFLSKSIIVIVEINLRSCRNQFSLLAKTVYPAIHGFHSLLQIVYQ